MGAFKVAVDLEDYDLDALLSKANKLPLQREDNTFTIVASRSHMSAETREYVQANARHPWRGKINLKRKLFKTMYGGRRVLPIVTPVLHLLWSGIPQQGRLFVSMQGLRL